MDCMYIADRRTAEESACWEGPLVNVAVTSAREVLKNTPDWTAAIVHLSIVSICPLWTMDKIFISQTFFLWHKSFVIVCDIPDSVFSDFVYLNLYDFICVLCVYSAFGFFFILT